MLDGAARLGALAERTAELGMPAIAMTDHGNVFGAYEFYKPRPRRAGVKPIIGIEAYFAPNISRFERKGVNFYDGGPDDVSGARRLHPHDAALGDHRGHAQPVPALHRRLARRLLQAAPHGPRAARRSTATGLIGTTGCPSGEVQVHLRHGHYDAARQVGRRLPGHPRPGQLLPRADGPRPRHREPGPRRAAPARQGPPDPAARHQRLPLRQRARTPRRRSTCSASTPARTMDIPAGDGPGQRFAFNGDGYYIKSRRRDARAVGRQARPPARPATTPCSSPSAATSRFTEGNGTYMPRFPCPPGENEDSWLVKEVETGPAAPLPGRHPRRRPQAGRLRGRRHHPDGLPGLLPRGRRLHQLGQGQRHPGRPRAAAPAPARWSPTRCGSPTSTRSSTA